MATSSITKNIVIETEEAALSFIEALEDSAMSNNTKKVKEGANDQQTHQGDEV